MVSRIASISEKVGLLGASANLESGPYLRRHNRIRSVHSSLKIEANSLTIGQVQDAIEGRPVVGDRKEIQEVKNAYRAYEMLPQLDPYSLEDLLKLHGVMTRCTLEESGAFRRGEEGVFDGGVCIFMAPPARLVPQLMENLFQWLQEARQGLHPLILSPVFHYEFLFIHPFTDGNGRMARLWHTAILAQWRPIFEYIPLESQIERFQQDYYSAIAQCHKAGSSNLFIEFMLDQTDRLLEELARPKGNEAPSEHLKRLLDLMEYGRTYSSAELMAKLGLKSKENFRRVYLNPAIALGLVAMTVPQKPRSRNQRYLKR